MPRARTGSSMSSRQMAYAATAGRKVTFRFLTAHHVIHGYLVGMDDYHWLVAEIPADVPIVVTTLIHKGSADLVNISPESTLVSEPAHLRVAVEEIGRGFFTFCNKTYFGKAETPANAKP